MEGDRASQGTASHRAGGEAPGLLSLEELFRATLRLLASRRSLLAIGVLLANDSVLKPLLPGWMTSKLSDLAGLYVAPFLFLLAALVAIGAGHPARVRRRALAPAAAEALWTSVLVATGLLFAALKLSPAVGGPALALLEAVRGSADALVVDPSDLLALAVLPVAGADWLRQLRRCRPGEPAPQGRRVARSRPSRRSVGLVALLAVSSLATVGTAPLAPRAVVSVASHQQQPGTLLISVAPPGYSEGRAGGAEPRLYRSVDAGDSWQEIGVGGEQLVARPDEPGTFYVARADGVWVYRERSAEQKRVWPPASGGSLGEEARSGPVEVPEGGRGLVYLGGRGAVLRSTDGGATWTRLALPGGGGEPVVALAVAPARPERILAGQGTRLWRTEDGGQSWIRLATLERAPTVLRVQPRDPDLVLFGDGQGAVYRSADGGASWQVVWQPDDTVSGAVSAIRFDQGVGETVYAAVRSAAGKGALLASGDRGASWRVALHDDVRDVALAPGASPRVFVAAGQSGVYRQRGWLRWLPVAEWEHANGGLDFGPIGFRDRLLQVAYWLGAITVAVLLFRLVLPRRVRGVLGRRPWEVALGLWALVAVVILASGLPQRAESLESLDRWVLASLPGLGIVVLLLRAPLSGATWLFVAVPALLVAGVGTVLFGAVGLAPLAVAFALLAAAGFLRSRGTAQGRARLMLAVVAANGLPWVLLAFRALFPNGLAGG